MSNKHTAPNNIRIWAIITLVLAAVIYAAVLAAPQSTPALQVAKATTVASVVRVQPIPTHDQRLARECSHVKASGSRMPYRICLGLAQSKMPDGWVVSGSLHEIVRRESGYSPCAVYPSRRDCSYTGSNACSLFQFYPCRCLNNGRVRPQANCGYRYIRSKFGTPTAALRYHNAHGSY